MNSYIKGLYDMAESKDKDTGMSKFDEQKLRRSLESNTGLMAKNKDTFRRGESKFSTCTMYDPCHICDKCKNKASHLYVTCQTCLIPICVHTYKDRTKMIRRDNFKLNVSPKVKAILKELTVKAEVIRSARKVVVK